MLLIILLSDNSFFTLEISLKFCVTGTIFAFVFFFQSLSKDWMQFTSIALLFPINLSYEVIRYELYVFHFSFCQELKNQFCSHRFVFGLWWNLNEESSKTWNCNGGDWTSFGLIIEHFFFPFFLLFSFYIILIALIPIHSEGQRETFEFWNWLTPTRGKRWRPVIESIKFHGIDWKRIKEVFEWPDRHRWNR